ncbi:MAG: dihydrodipicolinate synthase family protein [Marinosulfonomonas sp.]|nr:MAG: dihydrodipicolinate synthase family protein [Marinosulfonomonas sp.]
MTKIFSGIVPVMLTPFTSDNKIDWDGLEHLTEWYIQYGVDTLFAVCQSSEMQALSLAERAELATRTVKLAAGRVPVIASGHISDNKEDQREELRTMAGTGINGLILVTNHLDPKNAGEETFRTGLNDALGWLPSELPLGLYECPAPYRRLLSDDEFKLCRDSGRFNVLKDVSCNLDILRRRVEMSGDSGFAVVNANAAIAAEAMRAGSLGFAGVFNNFHPDLYKWLYENCNLDSNLRRRLETFLALSGMAEPMGYPKLAKLFHKNLGTFASEHTRVIDFDIEERYWAAGALLDHITAGTESFRSEIAAFERERAVGSS